MLCASTLWIAIKNLNEYSQLFDAVLLFPSRRCIMTHQRPVGVRARLVGGGAFRPPAQVAIVGNVDNPAAKIFDDFCSANTCQGIMTSFQMLCDTLDVKRSGDISFYHKLKSRLQTWRAQSLWAKLDKRAAHRTYRKGQACKNTRVSPAILFVRIFSSAEQRRLFVNWLRLEVCKREKGLR